VPAWFRRLYTINGMRYSTVLFDLDGTLVDSGEMILSSFRHAARTVLERDVPDEQLAALVGGSNIYDQMRTLDETRVDELVRVYREHNAPLHTQLAPFSGIEHVLQRLRAEGRKLGIVTAKRRATVDLAFAVLPLEPYFDAVVTSEMTERHKPHPEPVLAALELLGASASETAFVGDSPYDVGAGKGAGVFTVAVSWGKLHPEERLLAAGADVVVHSPEELYGVL
jgi:pyrophosphatase PpaX